MKKVITLILLIFPLFTFATGGDDHTHKTEKEELHPSETSFFRYEYLNATSFNGRHKVPVRKKFSWFNEVGLEVNIQGYWVNTQSGFSPVDGRYVMVGAERFYFK
ncbi:hypothetical protein [Sediminitomix flava]|uniref:Uncharacterized protein n=1 Tax=Sediminitomix flava TaxID=379075 RepID=A0A315YWX7_SEDFL|nr:hypothetical protein [Sediminitomix flava]PWJ34153.1 hypothetical protein BC781_11163 [Sediminitomix flava]